MRSVWALFVLVCVSCGGREAPVTSMRQPPPPEGSGAPEPPKEAPAEPAPELRLDRSVVPREYAVDLTLDPGKDSFTGAITIPVDIARATRTIWLHGKTLTIRSATLDTGKQVAATARQQGEFIGLALAESVGPGQATLRIAYSGKLPDNDTHGLFRQSENGVTYLYSQFEATEARRAFPCFDEPSFKVPWQVTLHVPKGMVALSNTMPERESDDGDLHTVAFAKTRPLPSYLVALAVGPFELVDMGTAGQKKVPLRLAVPKGRTVEARYAKATTAHLIEGLEKYLGLPYPYDKLDSVVIPTFLGAMENPGMITYSASIILAKPEQESIEFQQGYASIGAHEIAHHWFGDMVTMAWWDDIWLNESFADFMADRVVDDWQPAWGIRLHRLQAAQGAFAADSLVSARKIHSPIKVHNDIGGIFDAISYAKGGAVLSMFESFVGRDVFQKTLHDYLAAHAYGNATSQDFISALAAASKPEVSASFATFLDQGGIPMVSLDVACTGGKAELALEQQRFLPIGSTGSAQGTWLVPMCVAVPKGKTVANQCFMLDAASKRIPLETAGCPAWVDGNAGGRGYYRVRYARDLGPKLLKSTAIDTVSRAAALYNLRALVDAGQQPMSSMLAVMPDIARDKSPDVVEVALELAASIEHYIETPQYASYRRFLGRSFAGPARAAGWKKKKGESATATTLRPRLLVVAGVMAQDPALIADAKKLAATYLKAPESLDPETAGVVLSTATHGGDVALAGQLDAAFAKTQDHRVRGALLAGMVLSTDPAVRAKAIARLADHSLTLEELIAVVMNAALDRTSRDEMYTFMVAHIDDVIAALPFLVRPAIVRFSGFYCDPKHRGDLDTIFAPKVKDIPGGAKELGEATEAMDVCIAKKQAAAADLAKFFAN